MSQWQRERENMQRYARIKASEFNRAVGRTRRDAGEFGPNATVIGNGMSHEERTRKSQFLDLNESRARLGWEPINPHTHQPDKARRLNHE